MKGANSSVAPRYVPWDIEVARINFGANCGPASFATATRREVCRIMQYFAHFDHSPWTTLTQMRRAFLAAGQAIEVYRCRMPTRGVVLVQWLGPWTQKDLFSRWSLVHTHWIAVEDEWIFDCTAGEWQTRFEWQRRTASAFLSDIPHACGWAVKYGIEVITSHSNWLGSETGASDSVCGEASNLDS